MDSLILISVFLVVWSFFSRYFANRTEKPQYEILEKRKDYELRQYDPFLVAELDVRGENIEAANQGFGPLADYIYGNNEVLDSEEFPEENKSKLFGGKGIMMHMVAPVMMTKMNEGSMVAFPLSKKYDINTIPKPNNPRVRLRQIPPQKIAAISFSWYGTKGRVRKYQKNLLDAVSKDGLNPMGTPILAFYNPPFAAPFLNRNEVLVEVA